jgi:ATP-dependent DNA helicase DinG
MRREGFVAALEAFASALDALAEPLQEQAARSEGLASCARRAEEARATLERLQESAAGRPGALGRSVQSCGATAHHAAFVRRAFQAPVRRPSARVDLHVRDSRGRRQLLGISSASSASRKRGARWPSPFDYAAQALSVPAAPAAGRSERSGVHRAVVDAAIPVLKASGGRAFLLFTTLRALRRAHALLAERLPAAGLDLPLLVQGTGSRSELLERFRRLGNAVLLGAASFWEGVDVRGEALSVVSSTSCRSRRRTIRSSPRGSKRCAREAPTRSWKRSCRRRSLRSSRARGA